MENRIHVNFNIPDFANLYLDSQNYTVTVAFPINKEMYDYMKCVYRNKYFEAFSLYGRYFCRIKRTYPYNISFATACIQSYDDKNTLMIMMRESKIALLKFEISSLKK